MKVISFGVAVEKIKNVECSPVNYMHRFPCVIQLSVIIFPLIQIVVTFNVSSDRIIIIKY